MKKRIEIALIRGSLNECGDSNQIIKKLIESFNNNGKRKFSYHWIKTVNLLNCKGCKKCFNTGNCILDENDNFSEEKMKLINSKIIIISSPVYVDNVSGSIKTFIDRLALWTHIMALSGKFCILIITTQNTGVKEVSNYLYKILTSLGLVIVGVIIKKKNDNLDFENEQIENAVFNTLYYMKEPNNISTRQMLEKLFSSYSFIYNNYFPKESKNFEMNLWKEKYKGMITFQDYIDSL